MQQRESRLSSFQHCLHRGSNELSTHHLRPFRLSRQEPALPCPHETDGRKPMCRHRTYAEVLRCPSSPDMPLFGSPASDDCSLCCLPMMRTRMLPHSRVGKQRLMPLGHRFLQSSLGTGLASLGASGSPLILHLSKLSIMDRMMTLAAEHYRLALPSNHCTFPYGFAIEILQPFHMMNFI